MAIKEILDQIDAEIARLRQARAVFVPNGTERRGQSALSTDRTTAPAKKRKLSPEGRARIAAAVKRRWAAQKAAKKEKA